MAVLIRGLVAKLQSVKRKTAMSSSTLMCSFFLRAKHWQIFILIFGVYCVGQILALKSVVHPIDQVAGFGILFWIVMAIFGVCYLTWFWSMGSFLESMAQPELKLKLGLFRFALVYTVSYAFFFFRFVLNTHPVTTFLIVPLHLIATFCLFYILYFDSKSLALIQRKRPVSFYDYAGLFFLLWLFPIGVWFIQPKINRLYVENKSESGSSGVGDSL